MPGDRGANAQRPGSPMAFRVGCTGEKALITVTKGVRIAVRVVLSTNGSALGRRR